MRLNNLKEQTLLDKERYNKELKESEFLFNNSLQEKDIEISK
jgi:hypothetical protein